MARAALPETSFVRVALATFDLVVGVGGRLVHAYRHKGDGGAMYAPQALWSQTGRKCSWCSWWLDNREYGLLKE